MSTVYIVEQGAVVRQSSQHLVVAKKKERITHIPLIKTDRLVIFGNVQLTTQAINMLLREGIDVSFLTRNGRLRGRLVAAESKNVFVRLAQYERYLDDEFQVETARDIVRGKIRNCRASILLYQKNNPSTDLSHEKERLDEILKKLEGQTTVNSIMGAEGASTAAYFRAYGKMFRTELRFTVRTKRPPKDPVNALLSLGYTLLTNEVLALVVASGMDPYIGFLHGVVYGRPSLALDLVEEFRQPVIDRFTLNLFNNEIFVEGDFRKVEKEGVYLKDDAFKRYLRLYEERMRNPVATGEPQGSDTFRGIMKKQVQAMGRCIKNRGEYAPYVTTW